MLAQKNKKINYLERVLKQPCFYRRYICKTAPSTGSREPCRDSQGCSCGEYCDFQTGTCKSATCRFATDCLSFPGFTLRFQCKNNICMPPQDVYQEAFVLKFDGENIPNAPNATATV